MAIEITGENIEQEGTNWRYDLEARDNGNVWTRTFYSPEEPTDEWKASMKSMFLAELGVQVEYDNNPLNDDFSSQFGDEFRRIISESVKYIRANQTTIGYTGFVAWFDKKFPTSIFSADKVLKFVLEKLNKKSFDEVKTEFVSKKFVGVDD